VTPIWSTDFTKKIRRWKLIESAQLELAQIKVFEILLGLYPCPFESFTVIFSSKPKIDFSIFQKPDISTQDFAAKS